MPDSRGEKIGPGGEPAPRTLPTPDSVTLQAVARMIAEPGAADERATAPLPAWPWGGGEKLPREGQIPRLGTLIGCNGHNLRNRGLGGSSGRVLLNSALRK